MKIRNVIHKGLRQFILNDDTSGLPAAVIPKIRNIVSFLQDMGQEEELRSLSTWKPHQLSGDRKGTWGLHVTRNWRLTFRIDQGELELIDLNYEDYH
jgi:proteic killer suppression protein